MHGLIVRETEKYAKILEKSVSVEKRHTSLGGEQVEVQFKNGYGASIITGYGAYSDEDHPYEVAVLDNGLTYDTPITNDVLGYLDEQDVLAVLGSISRLSSNHELVTMYTKIVRAWAELVHSWSWCARRMIRRIKARLEARRGHWLFR